MQIVLTVTGAPISGTAPLAISQTVQELVLATGINYDSLSEANLALAIAAKEAAETAKGLAEGAAADTAADRIQTGLDVAATASDRIQTGLDAAATDGDRVQTGLDRVQTGQDVIATAADRVQTGLDAVATAADRVQTGLDAAATAQDAIATAADRVQTGLDASATAGDAIATAADRVQTGLDAAATAGDRVQTGLDAAATAQDAIATAADRVQTGLDVVATGADRVQTGLDAVATAADRVQTGLDAVATAADAIATAADRVQTGIDSAAAISSAADAELDRQYASEWANKTEDSLVSVAAGGDGVDDYSARHHAAKASDSASAASGYLVQTEYARDQALAGLGAADNSQVLSELLGTLSYAIDMADQAVREILRIEPAFNTSMGAIESNVTTYDAAITNAIYAITHALGLAGVTARAISGGDIILRAATAAEPSLSPAGDRNTGLFFPAADVVAIATAGLERARFTADGRLGIGTNAPSGLLDVLDDKIRVRTTKTPSSSAASGNAGEICWDSAYFYVCTATNVWKRTPLTSW